MPLTAEAKGHRHCLSERDDCAIDDANYRIQHPVAKVIKKDDTSEHSDSSKPFVAPINTLPAGQSYGRWAVEWQQWLQGIPAPVNPASDMTGEFCAQRQVDDVWFLAGALSSNPIVRDCKIPAGKSLFLQMIGTGYGGFLNDPLDTLTEEYIRTAGSCTVPAQITARIDNFKVPNPTQYFTGASGSQSPFFNIQLPPNNVFGADETIIPQLLISPSAEQGYYLFIKPLSSGAHTIHWNASGCTVGGNQDITYNLIVSP